MAKLDKTKFPLIGIARFLEEESLEAKAPMSPETGKRMAKDLLNRTIHKSKVATEQDKADAQAELEQLEARMREMAQKKIGRTILMKDPSDLKIKKGLERMSISLPDYNLLKDSIKEDGINIPLLLTKDDEIICGRHRWQAAKELGLKEVPVMYAEEGTNENWLIETALKDNVCRRQLTKEDKIHYAKLLKEMGTRKKGPGRPSKTVSSETVSLKDRGKALGVSRSTMARYEAEAEGREKLPKSKKLSKEYEDIYQRFHLTIGKSKEKDASFVKEICDYLENLWTHMNLEKGNTVSVDLKVTIGRKEEV